SLNKMKEFKALGKTMIFVSHSIGQMKQFCDKILWLEFGRVKAYGEANEVLGMYETFLKKWRKMTKSERQEYKESILEKPASSHRVIKHGDTVVYSKSEDYIKESQSYDIKLESRLAHIRAGDSYIYESPNNTELKKSSNQYINKVYYVKRSATYRFEKYYLLSTEPSGTEGIIGWMKSNDVSTQVALFIDSDIKTFRLNGKGAGWAIPWGGKKQKVIETLKDKVGLEVIATESWMVGKNPWYKGKVGDKNVWVSYKNVKDE